MLFSPLVCPFTFVIAVTNHITIQQGTFLVLLGCCVWLPAFWTSVILRLAWISVSVGFPVLCFDAGSGKLMLDAGLPGGWVFRVSQYLAHFSQSFMFQGLQATALICKGLKRWTKHLRQTNKKPQRQKTYSLASMSFSKNLGKCRKLYFPACFPITLEFDSEESEEAEILLVLWLLLKHMENLFNLILLMRPCTSSSPVTFVKRPVKFISWSGPTFWLYID